VLVEPDGNLVSLVAAFLEGDWDTSDEALAAGVREWLSSLLGVSATAFGDGSGNGSGLISEAPYGR
jgi:hypothetical protein